MVLALDITEFSKRVCITKGLNDKRKHITIVTIKTSCKAHTQLQKIGGHEIHRQQTLMYQWRITNFMKCIKKHLR